MFLVRTPERKKCLGVDGRILLTGTHRDTKEAICTEFI
jgi:hypothetical protein